MTLMLQILAIYVVLSLSVGLLLAVAVGRLIRRGDRRREQEVTALLRSRAGARRR